MILDGLLSFSNLQFGDLPTLLADTASANVIDQGVKSGVVGDKLQAQGGAYVAPWLFARAHAAFTSGGLATIQVVLQDSNDNGVADAYVDRLAGPAIAVANAGANAVLVQARIPPSLKRYLRLIYRIAVAAMTAGTVQAFLTMDSDVIDNAMRQSTASFTEPSSALDESQAQGVLAQ